ncbi:putative NBD/HSP70 family sugar kinase [Edaphobacter lichenicola]|uniref:NBD/HSP70 family sugar kinase n=1 Tax=Tunturiibacter lichenicola TaxID=2051959 RepID=A0A7W8J5R1_9BACT|nr:putative NBD/HSP70 family sugar kinase [Edaphobacter lichenicola]
MHLTEEGDPLAIKAIQKQALHLGQGLRLVTAALSPELILITGAFTTAWSAFGSIVQDELVSGILAGSPPALRSQREERWPAFVELQRSPPASLRLSQLIPPRHERKIERKQALRD